MTASVIRALGTVLTLLVTLGVTATAGETAGSRTVIALISTAILVALEWVVRWAPRHLGWARQHLDVRARWTGVWIQVVRSTSDVRAGSDAGANAFSIFRVFYEDQAYQLVGCAFDATGTMLAEWQSVDGATFSGDGRRISYTWDGSTSDGGRGEVRRLGLATNTLRAGENDRGYGQVQHVGLNLRLDVDVVRVTEAYLRQSGLVGEARGPSDLLSDEARQRFAVPLARALRVAPSAR